MTTSEKCALLKNKEISKTQARFLEYCQKFAWGKLEVTIKNGEPTIARIVEQTVKFDD